MTSLTTVTQKGQITLPVWLRTEFGLKPYGRVRVEKGNGYIKVHPVKDLLDIAGSVKPVKGKSVFKAREDMERNYKRF